MVWLTQSVQHPELAGAQLHVNAIRYLQTLHSENIPARHDDAGYLDGLGNETYELGARPTRFPVAILIL